MSLYDVIVIGGGHNGLTTATLLAKKGQKVLVLEKSKRLGGIAAGEEFYPGYHTTGLLHDTSGVRSKVVADLELKKFGLILKKGRPSVALLSEQGDSIHLHNDAQRAAENIEKISSLDAAAYIRYQNFLQKVRPVITDLFDRPPPQIAVDHLTMGGLLELAKKGMRLKGLGNQTMLELLRVAPMCVADFLNEHFETEFLKAGLAAPALYGSYAGPWSAYSTINLLLWESASQSQVVGGPQALVDALQKAAIDAGVEIRKDVEVQQILLDEAGKACGVRMADNEKIQAKKIASSCTPKKTFLKLLDEARIDYRLEYWIRNIRSRGTTAKINIATNKKVELNGQSVSFARTGNSIDEMEKAFDPIKYRSVTQFPFLDIHIPTIENPELAPEGVSVVSVLAHQIPYDFESGWTDENKHKLGQNVLEELEKYAPGISDVVVHIQVESPLDLEEKYGLTEGHIFHGEHFVDQLLTRPIPSCMHYKTPIPGLFLCGSGSHPGGGITCAPGAMAVKAIMD